MAGVFAGLLDGINDWLAVYDPEKGSFWAYLRLRAWNVVFTYTRSERRRRHWERQAARAEAEDHLPGFAEVRARLAEIEDDLEPRELAYVKAQLGMVEGAQREPLSAGQAYRLFHRVLRKLQRRNS